MEKELFEKMLKDYLKDCARLTLSVDEDKKSMYDNSVSYTLKVQLKLGDEVILSDVDTLYL